MREEEKWKQTERQKNIDKQILNKNNIEKETETDRKMLITLVQGLVYR